MTIAVLTDYQKVVNFKLEWLLSAGYGKGNAIKIAESEVDWHLAYDLRMRCEDEKLCMRILFGGQ